MNYVLIVALRHKEKVMVLMSPDQRKYWKLVNKIVMFVSFAYRDFKTTRQNL